MRRIVLLFGGLAIAAAYLVASALPALATDSGTVNAQVTVATPCLTILDSTLDFGTAQLRADSAAPAVFGVPNIRYRNCGSVPQQVFVRGTDATGSAALWTLTYAGVAICSTGPNRYGLADSTAGVNLEKADRLLRTMSPGELPESRFLLTMPCTGSAGAGRTMTFQIVYTATF